jgi:UPF0176 protein
MENRYRVLLYYKFVEIENPEEYTKEHLELCRRLNLKGRILIASEGLNGTVSGSMEDTAAYMRILHEDPRFDDMVFKESLEEKDVFRKLFVRHKGSIISLNPEDEVSPLEKKGEYLSPKEWKRMMEEEDVVILDGRNGYEWDLGHFRGAIRPDIESFREFPEWIDENLAEYRDKKIMTYCTGGIRCEKLTGVLLEHGFKDVFHLEGGIVTYGQDEETKGKLWDGKCYVFDERIAVRINQTDEDVIVSSCTYCGSPSDRYINCTNDDCHMQFLCCESCEDAQEGFCSDKCRAHALKNPDRDARVRLKEKAKLYSRYGQDHLKAKEAAKRLQHMEKPRREDVETQGSSE